MHLTSQKRIYFLTRQYLQAEDVTLTLGKSVECHLKVAVCKKVGYNNRQSVAPSKLRGQKCLTDTALALKLYLSNLGKLLKKRVLADSPRDKLGKTALSYGVDRNLVHRRNREIGKAKCRSKCLPSLLAVAVSHRATDVYVNFRVHLTLVKIQPLIELVKSCKRLPIYLGYIVARSIVAVVGKLCRGAEATALPVATVSTRKVVLYQKVKRLEVGKHPLVNSKSCHKNLPSELFMLFVLFYKLLNAIVNCEFVVYSVKVDLYSVP